jgi:hypothetical protein
VSLLCCVFVRSAVMDRDCISVQKLPFQSNLKALLEGTLFLC